MTAAAAPVDKDGGAATTGPRKPDCANLFPMFDVDWDDPSVAELARRRNQHPVEVMIALALENGEPTGNYAGQVLRGRLARR